MKNFSDRLLLQSEEKRLKIKPTTKTTIIISNEILRTRENTACASLAKLQEGKRSQAVYMYNRNCETVTVVGEGKRERHKANHILGKGGTGWWW